MLGLLLALHVALSAAPPAPFDAGLKRYESADFAGAAAMFRKALDQPQPPEDEARAAMYLGLALFNLNDAKGAAMSFEEAIVADPQIALPDEAPPKVQPLFNGVRNKVRKRAAAAAPQSTTPPAAQDNPDFRAPPPPAPPAPALDESAPVPDLKNPPAAPEPESATVPAWIAPTTAGAGGALIVASGIFALISNNNYESAWASPRAAETRQLAAKSHTQQSVAIGLGVGGLVVLTAAAAIAFFAP